jgi:ELWxxDGT repeat protein
MLGLDNILYFVDDGVHGYELWSSDGCAEGTRLVADVWPGTVGSDPSWLTNCAGKVAIVANDGSHGSHGQELWVSDGTESGTVLVADIAPGSGSSEPEQLVSSGERLWLSAYEPAHDPLPTGRAAGWRRLRGRRRRAAAARRRVGRYSCGQRKEQRYARRRSDIYLRHQRR